MIKFAWIGLVFGLLVPGTSWADGHFTESTVHSAAIVTDSLTGLIWQKAAATDKTWEEALAYCEASTAGGTGDWRLPTKKELVSLVDFATSSPASEFPDISSSTTYFWSSTTYKGAITKAWGTRFSDGRTYYSTKSESQPALCVRSPLRDNSNGTITDSAKGITWMKCAQGMTFNAESNTCEGSNSTFQYCDWNNNSCNGGVSDGLLDGGGNSEAWDTCNTLEFAGHTDWRVPTKEELGGLISCSNGHVVDGDYPARCSDGDGDFTTPAIDTSLFSNFSSTWFWTSASYADNSLGAWHVYFFDGNVYGYLKDTSRSVVCVR
jgi:hypothetical protein